MLCLINMNKIQIIYTLCLIIVGILIYSSVWVNLNITLSCKLMFTGVVLFLQSTLIIISYDALK